MLIPGFFGELKLVCEHLAKSRGRRTPDQWMALLMISVLFWPIRVLVVLSNIRTIKANVLREVARDKAREHLKDAFKK